MRYVPLNCIREGSILGTPLLGSGGEILLRPGTHLTSQYLSRIDKLDVQGLYIEDDLSEGLEIANTLSYEVRSMAVQGVKNAFVKAAAGDQKNERQYAESVQDIAGNIVDEILSKDSIVLNMIDIKVYDEYTFYHCVNVTVLSVIMGIGLNFSRDRLIKIAYAGLMHDIGKVFISNDIITKQGRLTPDEMAVMQKHPRDGYNYLREKYGMSEVSARGVLEHHERYDGSGYPDRKKGTDISEFGRIIAVADVYDALISDRAYRKALFAAEAMEYIMGGSGNLFDPRLVQDFSKRVALFPTGTCVALSNHCVALVMENFEGFASRPLVKVFMERGKAVKPYLIDLCHDYTKLDITITATVAL